MRIRFILLNFVIAIAISSCNTPSHFKSDVETAKKPWTNLNFNNDPANFQFGIMSDNNGGSRYGVFADGVKKLNLLQPEFVMCVGDLIPGYTTDTSVIKRDWKNMNGIISGLQMPFFYLPGNHDITNKTMQKEWEILYGRRYYSFVYKKTLFITLDTNDDENFNLTTGQTDFVLNTLKKNADVRWTFIFMHHPIWTYNTDGRFGKIEAALKNRKYTVIAGHEHHYHQAIRNEANYYILATTGAGSALRGNYFGEFDHVSWVTMKDNGPVITNLRLDGILPHDISTDKTNLLAKPLIENTSFNHLIVCNKGDKFRHGTLYLSFKNPTDTELQIKLNFFHHHQLQIEKPELEITLPAGGNGVTEIPFTAIKPVRIDSLDLLNLDWEMNYNHPDYPKFGMHGRFQMPVEPTKSEFIDRTIPIFVGKAEIGFVHPYKSLESVYKLNDLPEEKYSNPIPISETSRISFYLKNQRDEFSSDESRRFDKSEFYPPATVSNPLPGLNYKYYEGNWPAIPEYNQLSPKAEGIADNLKVADLALRKSFWGVCYAGFLKAEDDDFYQFMIKADDSCRFYIDGKLVADEKNPVKGSNYGTAALRKGFHSVRLEYLAKEGNNRLRFYIKKSSDENWVQTEGGYFFH